MKKYKHLFFDLDHTLWDFETNAIDALTEVYHKYSLDKSGIPSPLVFIKKYLHRDAVMWEQYRYNRIDKDTLRNKRFEFTFADMGLDTSVVPPQMTNTYIQILSTKSTLFPFAHEVLSYLKTKYMLHIITNGFSDVQQAKMASAGLTDYFSEVITSDRSGYKKPNKKIFYYSLKKAKAKTKESIMIGDSLDADILSAKSVGIDQIYFNPKQTFHNEKITFEIKCLSELKKIL